MRRWTEEEERYLEDCCEYRAIKDLAYLMGRSESAIRQKLAKMRLRKGPVKHNLLIRLLQSRFRHLEDFTPSVAFYQETGIKPRRFWAIYHGRKPIAGKEYAAIADYFNISIREAVETRQLMLFDEEEKEN